MKPSAAIVAATVALFCLVCACSRADGSTQCVVPLAGEDRAHRQRGEEPSMMCPPCKPISNNSTTGGQRRVRREVRSLTAEQLSRVARAFHVMKNTSQEDGEAFFGRHYRQWDYFVVKHGVTTTDARGDQGHFSAAFMTWHSAFVFEFENSLLAVDPRIDGLPYWDATIAEPSVFSPELFGSAPGTGPEHEVTDGLFPWFPISKFSYAPYEQWIDDWSTVAFNASATGFIRSETNTVDTAAVTRYGDPWSYDATDFETCHSLRGVFWEQWYECVELGRVHGKKVVKGRSISLHSGAHAKVGGSRSLLHPTDMGDFKDVVTSPNDPIFMLHHANLDRSKMWWMHGNQHLAPSYWGYPAAGVTTVPKPEQYAGINLNEPMASAWGFSPQLFGWSDSTALLTHADALCNFSPSAAPYVYDDMLDVLGR